VKLFRLVVLLAAVAIVVFPAGIALGQPPANAVRALPDTVERGETFNVTVNFTAPADDFNAISLTDFAPAGWNMTVSGSWSQPSAQAIIIDDRVEFTWWLDIYPNGTNFTALYKVTVPCNASLGNYTLSDDGFLAYFIGNSSHIFENITGDSNVTVAPPAICSTSSIEFYAAENGTNPQNQTLDVWSSTPCTLNWSLSDDADWLEEYPINGSCTDVPVPVAVSANISGMPLGNYTANITIESPDANNSPRIVPVTLHITLTGTLAGQVGFYRAEDPGDPTWETPIAVSFFGNSTKLEMAWSPINVTTDAYGNFTIGDIVVGTYDIGIKNYTALSKMAYGESFTVGGLTTINFGVLSEADCDDNDKDDSADYAKVINNYNAREIADPEAWATNELWKADYNRDKKIDASDYSSVLNNYGGRGDIFYYTH
jgi:hypothetical protein